MPGFGWQVTWSADSACIKKAPMIYALPKLTDSKTRIRAFIPNQVLIFTKVVQNPTFVEGDL